MPGKKRNAAGVAEDEEAFPRGGGSGLAPIVHKQLREDAYKEAEADLFGSGAKGRGKKRRKGAQADSDDDGGDEEDAFFRTLTAQDKVPKYAELLKFKSLNEGTKLWGAVAEVLPKELVISLPHGLKGHVAYEEASDVLAAAAKAAAKGAAKQPQPKLSDLFRPGQLVRCVVTGLSGGGGGATPEGKQPRRKRAALTLRVAKVNAGLGGDSVREGAALPACVKSVEDHGYLLSFGIKGATGFLPKKEAPPGAPLLAGSLVDVVVTSVKPGGHALASAAPAAVAAAATREWEGLNIGTLLPGALVTARVRHVLDDGLIASFLTFFTGSVDPFHLGAGAAAAAFAEGQRVKARILFVDAASKRVGLTLQRGLVDGGTLPPLPPAGTDFPTAVVRRVDEGLGVLVELAGGTGAAGDTATAADDGAAAVGFAHISNISDKKIEKLEGRFRPGQVVAARVIGGRPMDGLAAVTLKPSALAAAHLALADVVPGARVAGTVLKASEGALVVALTAQLRAVVPQLHMSDVPTARSFRKFKEGQKVAGRVLAVDAAAKRVQVTLKPALVDSKLPLLADLGGAVAGAAAHGVVTGVQPYGVFVSFYGDLAGLVPTAECGLPEGQTPSQAFAVGAVVRVRVTGVDPKRGRLRLSMVSKKKAAAAAEEAGGLGGLAPGDAVWGTVSAVHRRTAAAAGGEEGEEEAEQELTVAEVALRRIGEGEEAKPVATGRLEAAHLSDHPAAAAALGAALRVGIRLDGLLVLQRLETAKQLRVTRKASLVGAAAGGRLPAALGDLAEGAIYPGYVASVAPDGVFVRFLGDLTGRAGLPQLADTFVADPAAFFSAGQSVRAQVAQIDAGKGRFSLSLKRSLCAAGDAAMLAAFFADGEAAAVAAAAGDAAEDDLDWASAFAIGSKLAGAVHGVREYGTLCDLEAHSDVVGIAAPEQTPAGAPAAEGAPVAAVVLDRSRKDGVVDLSLRPELLARAAAAAAPAEPAQKRSRKTRAAAKAEAPAAAAAAAAPCAVGDKLTVTVELVKGDEGYAVVSLPEGVAAPGGAWLGALATADFNQPLTAAAALAVGDAVAATVAALPSEATGGRLLLALPAPAAGAPGAASPAAPKDAKAKARLPPAGTKTRGKVEAVHALHADVTLECGARGRVHATEAADADADAAAAGGASPLAALAPGQALEVVVLGRMQTEVGRRHGLLELSTRPSRLAAAPAAGAPGPAPPAPPQLAWDSIKAGQALPGFVQEVEGEHLWVVLSPTVRGRVFLPLGAASPEDCAAAGRRFRPGAPLTVTVTAVDPGKRALDAALGAAAPAPPAEGDLAVGVVTSVGGSGVVVQLAPGVSGRVALTDVHDAPVKSATAGLKAGQFVRVRVLRAAPAAPGKPGKAGSKRKKGGAEGGAAGGGAELSLRPSRGGRCGAHAAAAPAPASGVPPPPEALAIADIKPGARVAGYVKSAGPQGVFVCLARGVDARIKLRQLSDDFVDDPVAAYPVGAYVEGSVMGVEGGRVEMSLRRRRPPPSLEALEEGQVVRGRVKRVERFGVFVELDAPGEAGPAAPAGPTGLAHLSELADAFVHDVDKLFKVDQRVVARVLAVDKAAGRLSLGLKPSYFEGLSDLEEEEGAGEDGPDFDDELQAALGGSDGDAGGSSDEEEEGVSEEGASGSDNGDDSGEEEGEEPGTDFDLDEELLDAEAGEGSGSEEGSDSEEED